MGMPLLQCFVTLRSRKVGRKTWLTACIYLFKWIARFQTIVCDPAAEIHTRMERFLRTQITVESVPTVHIPLTKLVGGVHLVVGTWLIVWDKSHYVQRTQSSGDDRFRITKSKAPFHNCPFHSFAGYLWLQSHQQHKWIDVSGDNN